MTHLVKLLAVGSGGLCGAVARYLTAGLFSRLGGGFAPLGTLAVNVAGCLAVGLLLGWLEHRQSISEYWLLFLATGFLGSFTTFSALGNETWSLWRGGQPGLALGVIAANLLLGVGAVAGGYLLAK